MNKWITEQLIAKKRSAMPLLSFPAIHLLGVTVKDLISSSDIQAQAMYEIAKRCPSSAAVTIMDLSVEAECFGSKVRIESDEAPNVIGPIIVSPKDAEALIVPKMGAGRTGLCVDAVSKALKLINDRPVFAGVIGPFSLAGRLMGMTEAMYNCYDNPESVHITLEKATEFITVYALAYKKAGAHGVVLAEPAAGLLFPEFCEEFSSPYVKKTVDAVQDENFIVIYHNCGGSVNATVPEILSTGCAAYHFGNVADIAELLEKIPADVPVMGNIDPVADFRLGTPKKVREDTLALLKKCAGHSNFIISSGCDIPPAAPWENIDAFFEAVEEFYR